MTNYMFTGILKRPRGDTYYGAKDHVTSEVKASNVAVAVRRVRSFYRFPITNIRLFKEITLQSRNKT